MHITKATPTALQQRPPRAQKQQQKWPCVRTCCPVWCLNILSPLHAQGRLPGAGRNLVKCRPACRGAKQALTVRWRCTTGVVQQAGSVCRQVGTSLV